MILISIVISQNVYSLSNVKKDIGIVFAQVVFGTFAVIEINSWKNRKTEETEVESRIKEEGYKEKKEQDKIVSEKESLFKRIGDYFSVVD